MVAEVLVGRHVLGQVIGAERDGGGIGAVLPGALLLAAVSAILGLLGAIVPQLIFSLSGLLQAVAGSLGGLVALLVIWPLLAPLVLVAVIPALFAASKSGRLFHRFSFGMTPRDRERRYLAGLLTDRDPAKEVRAYDLARFLRARHDKLYDEHLAELRTVARRGLVSSLVADLTGSGIIAAAVVVLVWLTLRHDLSLASSAAAAGAIVILGQRLAFGGRVSGQISECVLYIRDFLSLLALMPASTFDTQPREETNPPTRIAATDVTFTYPGARTPALRGISMHIDADEVVALVGANGSGKTTLAKLLAGLYLPTTGSVHWDGHDTAGADRTALHASTAVIFQDYLRYCLPVRDNIALGRHERFDDLDGIQAAAARAGIAATISRLPDDYDTMLGPAFHGGVDLSVGQWQRIAIARVFFRDAPFVVLDEPTATLDAKAEHELFENIRDLFGGRSVLIISHRFSTVRNADRIYVMHHGAIIEHGTHDDLMAQGETYADLFALQANPHR